MSQAKRHSTGKASDYIVHFKKLFRSGQTLKVILYLRVSRCQQRKKGNLEDQKRYLLRIIRKYEKKYDVKIVIIGIIRETASGWSSDRIELEIAALKAEEPDAIVLAESSDRLMRNALYHSNKRPNVLPTVRDFEALRRDTGGVILATIVSPDRPWKKVRASQTKRGMRSKKQFGGRPCKKYPGYKKDLRDKWRPLAQRLSKQRYNVVEIQRILEQKAGKRFAWSTVKDWVEPKKP